MKLPTFTQFRRVSLYIIGTFGVIWETVHDDPQPALLVFFAMCLGFPAVINLDKVISLVDKPTDPPEVKTPDATKVAP